MATRLHSFLANKKGAHAQNLTDKQQLLSRGLSNKGKNGQICIELDKVPRTLHQSVMNEEKSCFKAINRAFPYMQHGSLFQSN